MSRSSGASTSAAAPDRRASSAARRSISGTETVCIASPASPRAKARYSSIMCSISSRSLFIASARLNGGARASSSRSRVRGVRRSWLTDASKAVRWSMWRWMRERMSRKAVAAARTSRAPCGLKRGTLSPRPKASAAWARRSMARTWLRMNSTATPSSSTVAIISHRTKICA
ncbi:hypothetical protein D3C77_540860 [compost metagenome]